MNELRKWVGNAQMTQREFAIEFEIPLRTVEDWMTGKSNPAPYLTKLLIEKLQSITEKRFVERAWKKANEIKVGDKIIINNYITTVTENQD